MEDYSRNIVNNIKQEPEENFELILSADSEPEEDSKQTGNPRIIVKKLDESWRQKGELFASYFVCDKCDYVIRQCRFMNDHKRVYHGKKCTMCDYSCDNRGRAHMSIDHRVGSGPTWRCFECPYKTLERGNLVRHCRAHFKKISCETCERKFTTSFNLKNHQQRSRHGTFATAPQSKFKCEECPKSFVTEHGRYVHQLNVHNQQECQCDLCGKIFNRRQLMRQHMEIHAKVPCPICRHKLVQGRLKFHIKQHNPATQAIFKCKDCEKVCRSRQMLNYHRRLAHTLDCSGQIE